MQNNQNSKVSSGLLRFFPNLYLYLFLLTQNNFQPTKSSSNSFGNRKVQELKPDPKSRAKIWV